MDLLFPEKQDGNAGLIVRVSQPGIGADRITGYEVALESSGILVLGRHRQNWEPIRRVPCNVPINQWITLTVRMAAKSLEVLVNGRSVAQYEDTEHPLETGTVGLRTWQRDARFRNLSIRTGDEHRKYESAFAVKNARGNGVSGMWRALRRGSAAGKFSMDEQKAFSGRQSQCLTFTSGEGEIGIENQGLNRWGMNFVKGKFYEGYVWVRTAKPEDLFVALESGNGGRVHAEKRLSATGTAWQRLDFTLKPSDTDPAGRFALKLKQPGSVTVGYAFLQPGGWGRFKGLPVRKDVAEGLINQGITVLRQGGCMVNAREYRWKKMIGPRDRRPPYAGWWYPHSSNGWGIFDFLNFCEAAGITNLAAQQKILQLAKQYNGEVWFDVPIGTDGPKPDFGGTLSFLDALSRIADGARHRVVIFEFNAGNHSHRRALANALAINAIERDGRLPIAASANCLQPDGQNDNGWNQGLLFLNPARVWLQPPGYVTRMVSGNFQPLLVRSEVRSPGNSLDVSAKRSATGRTLVLQVVNASDQSLTTALNLNGFVPRKRMAKVEVLSGALDDRNTADSPGCIQPVLSGWQHGMKNGRTTYGFPARSFTVIRFE